MVRPTDQKTVAIEKVVIAWSFQEEGVRHATWGLGCSQAERGREVWAKPSLWFLWELMGQA